MKTAKTGRAATVEEVMRRFGVSRRFVYYAAQFRINSPKAREVRLYMASHGWLFG